MLLDPADWSLAHRIDDLMPALTPDLAEHVTPETHACTLELATGVHSTVAEATAELSSLRAALAAQLGKLGLRPAVAGTHPSASTERTQVSGGARYQMLERGLRDLARREPTFALHVHVGVPLPELAIAAFDRIRGHLPLILALSANSPYWRGRDSGMASMRTPLFQAFPRVGVPRAFGTYGAYVETVDLLIRTEAVPEATFLWWDVRPQPRFGTVEVRVMDAQTRCDDTAAIVALVQSLAKMEAEQGYASETAIAAQEVIAENRFIAARDGADAKLVDVELERRIPVADLLADLLAICRPHAQELGCEEELADVPRLIEDPPARRQLRTAKEVPSLGRVVERLSDRFAE